VADRKGNKVFDFSSAPVKTEDRKRKLSEASVGSDAVNTSQSEVKKEKKKKKKDKKEKNGEDTTMNSTMETTMDVRIFDVIGGRLGIEI
jgi:preprotein translocase subunit SecF